MALTPETLKFLRERSNTFLPRTEEDFKRARERAIQAGKEAAARQQAIKLRQSLARQALADERKRIKMLRRFGLTPSGSGGAGSGVSTIRPSLSAGGSFGGGISPPSFTEPFPGIKAPEAPAYDQSRVDELTRKISGPQIRRQRTGLQNLLRGISSRFNNPGAVRLAARGGFEGFSQGLDQTLAGAQTQAISAYQPQFAGLQTGFEAANRAYLTKLSANIGAKTQYNQLYA